MISPMGPVLLMVNISTKDTMTEISAADIGPNKKPPVRIITSLGSYSKKGSIGIRGIWIDTTATKASALSMAMRVSLLVCFVIFMVKPPEK